MTQTERLGGRFFNANNANNAKIGKEIRKKTISKVSLQMMMRNEFLAFLHALCTFALKIASLE